MLIIKDDKLIGEDKELRVEAMYNELNKAIYIYYRVWFKNEYGGWSTDVFSGGKSVLFEKLKRKNTKKVTQLNRVIELLSNNSVLDCFFNNPGKIVRLINESKYPPV